MNVYVTGPNGRLGSQLVLMGSNPLYDDICNPTTEIEPNSVIINCAAKTDVDRCEGKDTTYYDLALSVNAYGVKALAEFHPNANIIHISTDYIFGGKHGPYKEIGLLSSNINNLDLVPVSCGYGFTKLYGEVLAEDLSNVSIVRTTGLYGGPARKSDFVKMLTNELSYPVGVRVTKELRGNQTYIPHLAEALLQYAQMNDKPKILNIASREVVSRYEFALMVASVWGLDKNFIYPVKNNQVPGWIAERPKKGGLRINLAEKLGLPIYTIMEGLKDAKANMR